MKRFIDLRGQILDPFGDDEKIPHFAFYCTIVDQFLDLHGIQDWRSKRDFLETCSEHSAITGDAVDVDRFCGLMPDWVPDK